MFETYVKNKPAVNDKFIASNVRDSKKAIETDVQLDLQVFAMEKNEETKTTDFTLLPRLCLRT